MIIIFSQSSFSSCLDQTTGPFDVAAEIKDSERCLPWPCVAPWSEASSNAWRCQSVSNGAYPTRMHICALLVILEGISSLISI